MGLTSPKIQLCLPLHYPRHLALLAVKDILSSLNTTSFLWPPSACLTILLILLRDGLSLEANHINYLGAQQGGVLHVGSHPPWLRTENHHLLN